MHIERHLAWFDTEEEAIEVAQQWAFEWINKRDGEVISKREESLTFRVEGPIETSTK